MVAESIREYLQASPFRPLTIVTASGREYQVPHPDFAWLTPTRRDLIVSDLFARTAILSVALISEVQIAPLETTATGSATN